MYIATSTSFKFEPYPGTEVTDLPERKEIISLEDVTSDEVFQEPVWNWVFDAKNEAERQFRKHQLSEHAKKLNVNKTTINKLYSTYEEQFTTELAPAQKTRLTNIEGQPLTLKLPNGWNMSDDKGIWRVYQGEIYSACSHPIMPVARYSNIKTGEERTLLWHSKPGSGRVGTNLVASSTIASNRKIIDLSDRGLSVNSVNASELVKFLADIEAVNEGVIPVYDSTSSLGWLDYKGETSFLPYDDTMFFDGASDYQELFDAINTPSGTLDDWRETIGPWRDKSKYIRIVLAASFSSVILKTVGSLPFFVHFWSSLSSTGKTVLLMIAASVWGKPDKYMQTFNTTEVGAERLAGFLNNLPMILDELQHVRDNWGRLNFNVYKLSQGQGKGRGNKTGGRDYVTTWNLSIITSGETPLSVTQESSGTKARVLEVELNEQLFTLAEGNSLVRAIGKNYGTAGRAFVEYYKKCPEDVIVSMFNAHQEKLTEQGVQPKQAMLAATLLTADELAFYGVWEEQGTQLTYEDIADFLLMKGDEDIAVGAYEALIQFYVENKAFFEPEDRQKLYGEKRDGSLFILSSIARKTLEQAGYNYEAALSAMREKGLLRPHDSGGRRHNTIKTRLFGSAETVRCVEVVANEQ